MSFVSLAAAYVAQYGFGLQPCILCLYQRVPFAVNMGLGMACAAFGFYGKKRAAAVAAALAGLAFLGNSALAAYHSGVERHWWKSAFESCAGLPSGADAAALLRSIEAAQTVPCDRIPWADPVFGLSMANANALMSLGLGLACLMAARLFLKARTP